jgi:ABC-type oligopeptide transport system substrate-binding subunit
MVRLLISVRRLILPAGLILLLAALQTSPTMAVPPIQNGDPVTLRVAAPAPASLDPVLISRFDPGTRDLVESLFVGLTRFDPVTQTIEPMLAESWTVSDDGLTWTFDLRDDIQWVKYDPAAKEVIAVRPVAAGDFVYAIQRACDPLRPSPVTANLMVVKGCLTVANAFPEIIDDLFLAREIGVRATGPATLEIDLLFPAAYFPTLLSTAEFRPLARESVRESEAGWATVPTLVSNGPYALQAWDSGGMRLARNPYWPDAYAGNVEVIEIEFVGDAFTAGSLFSQGEADLVRLTPDQIAAARATYPDFVHVTKGTSLTMLGFSFDRAMVTTPEVRRALALALDRDALVQQFFLDQAQAVMRFTPPGVVAGFRFRQHLIRSSRCTGNFSAVGYEGCNNVPEPLIVLVPEEDSRWTEIAQAIAQQWSTVLGCSPVLFEIEPLPRTLLIELAHSTYDPEKVTRSHIWLTIWIADYPDANAWIADALHCRLDIRTGRACGKRTI